MIILTGPDNTGKSTLAIKLAEHFKLPVIPKFGGRPWQNPDEWFIWLYQGLKSALKGVEFIADRFYIDDKPYSNVCRGGHPTLPFNEVMTIEFMLERVNPMIIVTDLPISKIKESYDEREQYPDFERIEYLREEFSRIPDSWPLANFTTVYFNYLEDPDYSKIIEKVDQYLKEKNYEYK